MAGHCRFRWRILALLVCLLPAPALAGTTQMVVQWRYDGPAAPAEMAWQLVASADSIRRGCGKLCIVEGHEVGDGAANIFVYVDDGNIDAMVAVLAKLRAAATLPDGMQVGIAQYSNEARSDWTWRPAFPESLTDFALTYPAEARGL